MAEGAAAATTAAASNEQAGAAASRTERSRSNVLVSSRNNAYVYVSLVKRYLETEPEVELSGLGQAISIVVQATELLKSSGAVEVTKIYTETVHHAQGETNLRTGKSKARIVVMLKKGPKFDEVREKDAEQRAERKAKAEAQKAAIAEAKAAKASAAAAEKEDKENKKAPAPGKKQGGDAEPAAAAAATEAK